MISLPLQCVVDANLGVKLVLLEPDSVKARQLFDHLSDPATQIHVPELFYLECANSFWKLVQRKIIDTATATAHWRQIKTYGIQATPVLPLADAALQLALQFGSTVYDATYVALAQHWGVPLITADDKLVKKFVGSPHQVLLLSTLLIPAPPSAPPVP